MPEGTGTANKQGTKTGAASGASMNSDSGQMLSILDVTPGKSLKLSNPTSSSSGKWGYESPYLMELLWGLTR